MKKMDALLIIKQEIYKDTIPSVEAQKALDYLEEYITATRVKVTSEALANIRKNTLKEFVEWYDDQVVRDKNGRPIARAVASLDEWVKWFLEERK